MVSKRYGFGVVGLGNISATHAVAISKLKGAYLHSCFSSSTEKAQVFAEKHGAQPYTDLKAFLADPGLDVVTLCTPSGAHLDPALSAAKAGKHLVIEKPLEITAKRCNRIIHACRRHDVKLVTVYPNRFSDVYIAMKKAIDEGRLGVPVNGSAYMKWFRSQDYYDSGAWRGTRDLDGGGCLMNQGIHSVDLLLWLMGDVVEVMAYAGCPTRKRIEVETNLVAILKYRNGALGTFEVSTECYPGNPKGLEICGTEGSMASSVGELVRWDFVKSVRSDRTIRERYFASGKKNESASNPLAVNVDGHRRQFQELVDVLKGKKSELTCNGSEGLRSVQLVESIYQSVSSGKPVCLRGVHQAVKVRNK